MQKIKVEYLRSSPHLRENIKRAQNNTSGQELRRKSYMAFLVLRATVAKGNSYEYNVKKLYYPLEAKLQESCSVRKFIETNLFITTR